MNLTTYWKDGKITVQDVEFSYENSEILESRIVQGISATSEEWLEIVVTALSFMPGKPNDDGTGFALCPFGTDPEMIGQLIAEKLRNSLPAN